MLEALVFIGLPLAVGLAAGLFVWRHTKQLEATVISADEFYRLHYHAWLEGEFPHQIYRSEFRACGPNCPHQAAKPQ